MAALASVDPSLDPALVAGMHLLGLVIVQGSLACFSHVSRYAIATPDVTFAMLMAGERSKARTRSGAGGYG